MITEILILSGVIYASTCRLAKDVSMLGIDKGRKFAYLYLSLGLIIKAVEITINK